jgi:hypothetical protein
MARVLDDEAVQLGEQVDAAMNVADRIDAYPGRNTRRATRRGRPRGADIDTAAKETLEQGGLDQRCVRTARQGRSSDRDNQRSNNPH